MKKRVVIFLLVMIVLWVGGDLGYSLVIKERVEHWEASVSWSDEGIRVGAETYSAGDGLIALLLVHGFNDTPETFSKMAPALVDNGFYVRALRLPGSGVPLEDAASASLADWVTAVETEVQSLAREHERVIVVGHSLGGSIAARVASKANQDVQGIVLLAPAIGLSDDRSPIMPARFWQSLADRLLIFTDVYESPFAGNDAADPSVQNPPYKPAFSTRQAVRETTSLMDVLEGSAKNITIPTLMVLSREDRIIDWHAAETYFQNLGSDLKQLKFYDSSRHALTIDYDWQNIVEDIAQFVQLAEPT